MITEIKNKGLRDLFTVMDNYKREMGIINNKFSIRLKKRGAENCVLPFGISIDIDLYQPNKDIFDAREVELKYLRKRLGIKNIGDEQNS